MHLEQLDVKTTFLHGSLDETIYMSQPDGFMLPENRGKVCMLKKSLYGLRQSSRQWYKRFEEYMLKIGCEKSDFDSCVFIRRIGGMSAVYLLLYVDDMLVASQNLAEINTLKKQLKSEFEMKELGVARRILGMDIMRDREKGILYLCQQDYVAKVLRRFNMCDAKSLSVPIQQGVKLSALQKPKSEEEVIRMSKVPYSNVVGSIMYTMVCTRPDISYATSVLSRYMVDHGIEHWEALKKLLRYLKGSSDFGIVFKRMGDTKQEPLVGFVDSDFASNLENRRSQSAYVFNLFGSAISWKSQLQSVVALSTTEADFMALADAVKEGIWLKGILNEFGVNQGTVEINCDSQSAIHLAKHQVFHNRSKHIDVRFYFVRNLVEKGEVRVTKIHTDDNAADALTKPLPVGKFRYCLSLIGMESVA